MNEPTNKEEWEVEKRDDFQKIADLIEQGHGRHCACRIVWGDGECSCRLSSEQ